MQLLYSRQAALILSCTVETLDGARNGFGVEQNARRRCGSVELGTLQELGYIVGKARAELKYRLSMVDFILERTYLNMGLKLHISIFR